MGSGTTDPVGSHQGYVQPSGYDQHGTGLSETFVECSDSQIEIMMEAKQNPTASQGNLAVNVEYKVVSTLFRSIILTLF